MNEDTATNVTGMFGAMTGLLTDMARGVGTEQLERVKTLVERRVADGRGEDGFSSLYELLAQDSSAA